jgi:formiminotetrahydrofolate cyclodeaminase
MRSYSDLRLRDVLDAFASTTPAPGGGSAAALAGAAERLRSLQPAIAALIDRDADAYGSVVAALRMAPDPENTDGPRQAAYDSALRGATDIPMETMRACREALRAAPTVATYCKKSTRGDVAVAIELLRAAVRGAAVTADANLGSQRDADYVSQVRSERQQLESESAADAEHALSQLVKGSALDIRAKPSTS